MRKNNKKSAESGAIEQYRNRILCHDTIEALKNMPDHSVDLIFADPPYFMQTSGILQRSNGDKFAGVEDEWDKFVDYSDYDTFTKAWLIECKRVLKADGAIWVIGSFQNIFRLGYIMQDLGYWIMNDVIWSKPNAVPNFSGSRFKNAHETLLWCTKDKSARYTFNYKTMKHLNNDKQDKSVWDIGICIGSERIKGPDGKKVHSTQKPEKLLYKVILATTKPGDIVLDPFFGTGTTGAVAKQLARDYIGIDNNQEYVDIAQKRIDVVTVKRNDITELKLEVKPPRVSIAQLIESKALTVNSWLYDKNGSKVCKVKADGHVDDGENTFSIHKMAAKQLKQTNHNGWDYFYIKRNGELTPINQLRYEYGKG